MTYTGSRAKCLAGARPLERRVRPHRKRPLVPAGARTNPYRGRAAAGSSWAPVPKAEDCSWRDAEADWRKALDLVFAWLNGCRRANGMWPEPSIHVDGSASRSIEFVDGQVCAAVG